MNTLYKVSTPELLPKEIVFLEKFDTKKILIG